MSSDMETMDAGKKPEEVPSEVDEKADDIGEVDLEKAEDHEEIEEPADEGKVEDDEEENIENKGSKIESGELKSPTSERPTRERKTVDRFKGYDTPRSSASKTLTIEKGRGTQLKDIPNVAFKLSKRKADENLQLLHSILFGKKSKVHTLKKNIGLFSGFVWAENEEKLKVKVKEKFEKCVKDKLLDFCDIMNISVNKASTKKEELVAKLVAFLESPHATTGALLADKEKGKKRKSKGSAGKSPSSNVAAGKSTKKQKFDSQPGKKQKSFTEEEDDDKSQHSLSDDDDDIIPEAETEHEDNDIEDEIDEGEDEHQKQKLIENVPSMNTSTDNKDVESKSVERGSPTKASKSAGKHSPKSSSPVPKKGAEAKSERKVKEPLTKKQVNDKESEKVTKSTTSIKKKSKSSAKASEKDEDSESDNNDAKEPTKEEMHAALVYLLKDIDFNTTTLSDILKQIGNHFGLDLIHRKSEVKDIISEVIQAMSDDEDDDSGNNEDDEA